MADEEQETVKECYKEYIGLVKIYFEDAIRTNLGKVGSDENDVVACIRPQPDSDLEDAMDVVDESPKKKIKIEGEEAMTVSNKTSDCTEESDDFVVII